MAYKGKFSPEARKARLENQEPIQQAAPVKAAAPAKAAETRQTVAPAPVKQPQTATPSKQTAAPVKESRTSTPRKSTRKKSRSNVGSLIFYTVYFFFVALILMGLFILNNWLKGWLVSYEAAQPTTKCEEVFNAYFADPDWEKLYKMAGVEDTLYEGKDAFVSYMGEKCTQELTYVETSAGLSGGHKYLLKCDEDVIGYFTLVDAADASAEIPNWQFGEVSLSYTYNESVTIEKQKGQTVYVNGVALTDDHTIKIGTTLAGNYGLKGPEIHTQYLDGLMQPPVVTAADKDGNSIDVSYNAETGMYTVQSETNTIPAEEEQRAIATAKTYALKMIEKASSNELAKYFDTSSQSYKTIISIDPWMQEWFFRSYEFDNESVHGYYRYSDDLFSVHVKLSMLVTRTDDTVKDYNVDHTFFFKNIKGTWKCTNMVNVDVSKQVAEIRLTFMYGEQVVSTNFYESDITTLLVPVPTAPEGQVFSGWVREDIGEDGKTTLSLVFTPDADGNVSLPAGNELEPMTLYPLFENAVNNDGGNQ